MALVQLNIPKMLLEKPMTSAEIAERCRVPPDRMDILLRAAVALMLIKYKHKDRYGLARRGAALVGVPGLESMIKHHEILYRDLADPEAFFRGETKTELADFWPYVFGGEMDAKAAQTYSDLMAQSQELVAEDTLRTLNFARSKKVLDVGGGSGAFLEQLGMAYPDLNLILFDLPKVTPAAQTRFEMAGMATRVRVESGSFLTDPIPHGSDAITLIRVLYDHSDETVAALLKKCMDALPAGGRLFISEPMLGGDTAERAGDVYFALYTLAMHTGKARSISEISILCRAAGFEITAAPVPPRPYVTRCLEAVKVV